LHNSLEIVHKLLFEKNSNSNYNFFYFYMRHILANVMPAHSA